MCVIMWLMSTCVVVVLPLLVYGVAVAAGVVAFVVGVVDIDDGIDVGVVIDVCVIVGSVVFVVVVVND